MAGPVKDREAFQRLSFLYQAAHCVLAQDPMNQALARFYCYTERTIAKRLVLRRDPSVKRTLCRGCSSLLIPGLTCTQRQRRCRGQRWTVQTCLTCQRSQRFLNDPDHLLWGDRPEAQLGSQAVIYTEHGTRSYNPKIKSHMLLRLSRPGTSHFYLYHNKIVVNICKIYGL
ncbi:ribonuclease P protein subunit p21 isoform X2 [Lontra canadensis]|uniref:ribonuclease P protein subunit p21 isoform X2 n=1 Tax=Lontra canadensis TaxID=76717 RepID=UPI0013F30185|nr:ribonuclease P protein subunit p21 isoform X2 [Lontra canadensis]